MPKVVSLFSGCGGMDLGFKQAGFDITWAIDNDKSACLTYEKNLNEKIICDDIANVDFSEVPDCDLLIGGPPCQAFSMIGKRDSSDRNFSMIWEFHRALKTKLPEGFIMENVTGLRSAVDNNGRNVLELLLKRMQNLGYSVAHFIVNSADFGVPQRRKRLIIMGRKGKKPQPMPEPTHFNTESDSSSDLLPWVTAREAIGDLPEATLDDQKLNYVSKPSSDFQKWARKKSSGVHNHVMPSMSDLDKKIISYVSEGGNYMDVPDSVPSRRIKKYKETGGRTTTYGRLRRDMPAYTINTYFSRINVGCNIHYARNRLITIREGLRLQSFGDNFLLSPDLSKRAKYSIVGNAVPPLLSYAIAKSLKNE